MKRLLYILLLLPTLCFGQRTIYTGDVADSLGIDIFRIPATFKELILPTSPYTSKARNKGGAVYVDTVTGTMYYYASGAWAALAGGGGGGSADSATFYTNYRADTSRTNIYTAIAQSPGSGTVTSITFSAPLTGGAITTSGTVSIPAATGSTNGYLTSTDWTTFNGKQSALGFTPENVANKATSFAVLNNALYPTTSAVNTQINTALSSYVPTARSITVNGTAQDLSADRTYTVTDATLSTSDVTDNNATSLKHGFLRKLSGTSTEFMNGAGNWATPIGTTYTGSGGIALTGNDFALTSSTIGLNGTTMSLGSAYTVTASANTLTTTTLNPLVVNSSLQTLGTISAGIWQGSRVGVTYGGTGSDLSATGGTSQVVRQSSTGAGFTVSQLSESEIAFTDITTNNASTTMHGYVPKLPNDATKYYDGTGSYSVPAGGGSGVTTVTGTSGRISSTGGTTPQIDLVTVNATPATYGSSTAIPVVAVDAYGRATTITTSVVVAPAGTLSGTALPAAVVTSSLTAVGAVGTGTWTATKVAEAYGGTNQTTYTTGDILYASASNTLSKLAAGTPGYVLTMGASVPAWAVSVDPWTYYAVSGSDFTTTSTSLVDITGLVTGTLSLNQKYEWEAALECNSSAGTNGLCFGGNVNGATAPASFYVLVQGPTTTSSSVSTIVSQGIVLDSIPTTQKYITTATQPNAVFLRGFFTTGGSGVPIFSVMVLKHTSGTATVYLKSSMRIRAVN